MSGASGLSFLPEFAMPNPTMMVVLISDALNDVVAPDQSIAQGSVAAFFAPL
jgi:hypothetical protein